MTDQERLDDFRQSAGYKPAVHKPEEDAFNRGFIEGLASGQSTLRDHFAAQVLAGLVPRLSEHAAFPLSTQTRMIHAREAYELADAMLEARGPKAESKP